MVKFDSRAAVLQHLQSSGWQISRSHFYENCAANHLVRNSDGTYDVAAVEAFAATYCRRLETGKKLAEGNATIAELREEIRLKRERVKLKQEEHSLAKQLGEFVARDDVELMIVGRAVALCAHLKAMVQMSVPDWIALADGDQARCREVIDTIQVGIEQHLEVFASDIEFEVIFEANAPAESGEEE